MAKKKAQQEKQNKPAAGAGQPKKAPAKGADAPLADMARLAVTKAAKAEKGEKYPREVNGYRLEKKLGEGSYGEVSLAIKIEPDGPQKPKEKQERYAIKHIKAKAKRELEAASDEIKTMQLLRGSKHVIDLIEDFQNSDNKITHFYLVMEFMAGGDLYDRIEQKETYSEQDARKIFTQVLNGVAYLHERRMCHRDLKPENRKSFRIVLTLDVSSPLTLHVL